DQGDGNEPDHGPFGQRLLHVRQVRARSSPRGVDGWPRAARVSGITPELHAFLFGNEKRPPVALRAFPSAAAVAYADGPRSPPHRSFRGGTSDALSRSPSLEWLYGVCPVEPGWGVCRHTPSPS